MRRAVFVDRDDTIVASFENRPANCASELKLLPGAAEGVLRLKLAGFTIVMVSNQGGIELGYLTLGAMHEMNSALNDLLIMATSPSDHGQHPGIDAFYFCPHYKKPCFCRKPKPGMITRAAKDLDIDLDQSYIIGDRSTDVEAGYAAGVRGRILISIDGPGSNFAFPVWLASSFLDAANMVLAARRAAR